MLSDNTPVLSTLYFTLVLVGGYSVAAMIITYFQTGEFTWGHAGILHFATAFTISMVYHVWKNHRHKKLGQ
ncbi:hypothetical protein EST55_09525 [Idiomarina sp. 29L]|uniref:hypothetical protein n=1 Tax=Idiomarina sp. 29L TaxID=2508877 RepID=UPI001011DD64|nr:hypothetical protein [Idiomarina sp. 29L]RXS41942.1 hypothetical protein EST55_09525 [Idiomarina sp. 29L]